MDDLTKYFELGATAVVAIAGYWSITKLMYKKNGNGYNKKIYDIGNKIADNELEHILRAIERQTNENGEWHRKQYEILCQIAGKIK